MNEIFEYMQLGLHEDELPEYTGIINLIFMVDSSLENDVFIERVANPRCNWIFDAAKVRERFEKMAEPNMIGGAVELS